METKTKEVENNYQNYEKLQKELEFLVNDYKRKSQRLDRIIAQSDRQQKKLLQLNEKLKEYQEQLEEKVQEEIAKNQEKEKILFQQSKLAAMGEMMDAVAHQWKQPISIIKMQTDMLEYDIEDNLIDKNYIHQYQEKVFYQIEHMTSTLNEFRTFFRPNKAIETFEVEKMIKKALLLVQDELIKHSIQIELQVGEDFTLSGVENEFKHLVLNIINNAKDAFEEKKITDKKLTISINQDDTHQYIEFKDNAGGIPTDIIGDIFKANVTTKTKKNGTGIGLYMSYQIAQKHHGTLEVENTQEGAKFLFVSKKLESKRDI